MLSMFAKHRVLESRWTAFGDAVGTTISNRSGCRMLYLIFRSTKKDCDDDNREVRKSEI